MIIYETKNLDLLPEVSENKKMVVTIGGNGYRCFVIHKQTDEFDFMNKNENLLDDVLKPIYKDNDFVVRQSKEFAVPGFYTIQPMAKNNSPAELSDCELAVLSYLQPNVRVELKNNLGIELFGLYTEEKANQRFISYLIPYHVDKLREKGFSEIVYQPHIADYLQSYNFPLVRSKMKIFNNKMRFHLNSPQTLADIRQIKNTFGLRTRSNTGQQNNRGGAHGPEI